MKKSAVSAALILIGAVYATNALAQDAPMLTKAPVVAPAAMGPPPPASCYSFAGFLLTDCQLAWYGVRLYGTVDLGGTYQTHGTPFDPNFPTGASYLVGAGGTGATNRTPGFGLGPNGLSQSVIGISSKEPIAPGWNFVSVNELAFDPYSALLANAPMALYVAKGTAQNTEALPFDSSRWGWLGAQNFFGVNSPTFGTLTFGRQNALESDGVSSYDPMGGSYAFSPIGYSGKAAGGGDTEDSRWTTAIKYRVNIGDFRLGLMGQPISSPGGAGMSAYNPNNGAISGDIGGDIRFVGPGVLSLDAIGTYERDAVNISMMYPGQVLNAGGTPTTFPATGANKATLSDQTAFMALAKYSFGSWGSPPPMVTKGPVPPSGPTGIPLTLYAGYEWIQFASPSDPQNFFNDDGFTFLDPTALTGGHGSVASINLTSINNNAFNALCGTGGGCKDEIFQVFWVGAKYGITKDLDIIGAYYEYIQNMYTLNVGNVCAVAGAHSQCAGNLYVTSVVLDWRFLPKWDAYIGTMYSAAEGGIANGDIQSNNWATTAGVRFRF
jgi:predicted porin